MGLHIEVLRIHNRYYFFNWLFRSKNAIRRYEEMSCYDYSNYQNKTKQNIERSDKQTKNVKRTSKVIKIIMKLFGGA